MRIIGGKYRGKKLSAPEGKDVRPTTDRAREALFNILNSRLGSLSECRVLDVFAGTGALGLEALSRGAAAVAFVDKDTKPVQKNIAFFPAEKSKIRVISADVRTLPTAAVNYQLIFADAPYGAGLSEIALKNLETKGWIAPGALCLVETARQEPLDFSESFQLIDERFYGAAQVRFLVYKA